MLGDPGRAGLRPRELPVQALDSGFGQAHGSRAQSTQDSRVTLRRSCARNLPHAEKTGCDAKGMAIPVWEAGCRCQIPVSEFETQSQNEPGGSSRFGGHCRRVWVKGTESRIAHWPRTGTANALYSGMNGAPRRGFLPYPIRSGLPNGRARKGLRSRPRPAFFPCWAGQASPGKSPNRSGGGMVRPLSGSSYCWGKGPAETAGGTEFRVPSPISNRADLTAETLPRFPDHSPSSSTTW